MNPLFTPVKDPALLPVVVERPQLPSADFDGDTPSMSLRSPYGTTGARLAELLTSTIRSVAVAWRKMVTSPEFIRAVNIERKQRRLKNQRRRRKSKANRKK